MTSGTGAVTVVVERRRGWFLWAVAPAFLVLHGIVSTCLPEKLGPLSTACIVLAEMAAMTAALVVSRRAEAATRILWWLVAASLVLHSTAMSLDAVTEATGTPVFNYVPGLSVFFSMLSGVPMLAAVSMQFDSRIRGVTRATHAILSAAIGALLYVQIFSLLTVHGSVRAADAVLISRWFDGIDVFLAVAATIRWFGAQDAGERWFFRVATIFLWVDAVLPAIHNRILMVHDFVWLDLFISAPYAVLFVLIVAGRRDRAAPASPKVIRLVQSGSSIFLSLALLVLGVIAARTQFFLGLGASLLSIVCYGVISTLAQSRGRETEESLLSSREVLEGLVGVDSLTGIPNRWAFDQMLSRECAHAERAKTPVSLLMIDVDHFKLLNDAKGHQAGDVCLMQIAGAVAAALPRATDFVARYGGEEFCAILAATDARGAEEVAKRVCAAVAEMGIRHPASPFGVVTVSVGFSTYDGVVHRSAADRSGTLSGALSGSLIGAADQALYNAKHRGRNRCEFAEVGTVQGWLAATGAARA